MAIPDNLTYTVVITLTDRERIAAQRLRAFGLSPHCTVEDNDEIQIVLTALDRAANHCPSCGYNLSADTPLLIGPWRIEPRLGVLYGNRLVTRRLSWTNVLLTIARADGRVVRLARITDSERNNTIASTISQMKRAFVLSGVPWPITTQRGAHGGYRWTG